MQAPRSLSYSLGLKSEALCAPQLRTLSCLCLGVCTWLPLGASPLPEEEVLKNPSGGELRISKRERERERKHEEVEFSQKS